MLPDVLLVTGPAVAGKTTVADAVVVLTASRGVLADRNRRRSGHRRLSPEVLDVIRQQMAGWSDRDVIVLDTTGLDVGQSVAAADRALRGMAG